MRRRPGGVLLVVGRLPLGLAIRLRIRLVVGLVLVRLRVGLVLGLGVALMVVRLRVGLVIRLAVGLVVGLVLVRLRVGLVIRLGVALVVGFVVGLAVALVALRTGRRRIVRRRGGVPLLREGGPVGRGRLARALLLFLLLQQGDAVRDVLDHRRARVGDLRRPMGHVHGDAGRTRQLGDPGLDAVHLLRCVLNLRQQLTDELRIHPVELGHGRASTEISAHFTVAGVASVKKPDSQTASISLIRAPTTSRHLRHPPGSRSLLGREVSH
ncbi:hypothetical protein FLX07_15815 [Microbispora bryophytorum]|nr:hypothetical protein FLX07_15815 [Microbispora bryophytorum]